ncbi:membrane protein [Paenibacillus camerounensis]|uniref:glycan biosynthesis hexose transferase WsfD n=1 Tax=Paenibacillus camerounensis TaxID=1243663 RepID=UPI0005AA8F61|nr:membrane protein [Paenibacillus camerounensis]
MIYNTVTTTLRQSIRLAGLRTSPAFLAAFGVLLITVIALFTAPYIGMADNGDYFRNIYSNGLYFSQPDYDSQYFGYFVKHFGIYQYFNENGATLDSSQSIFIKLAIGLNKLLFSSTVFDIRFQAAIYTLLYVLAVYLLVEAITCRMTRKQGMLCALVAVFVFGDTGYTAYFNSFYSESIVLIMMLYVFAAWLLLYRKRYNDYFLLALFLISGLLLTTSKQQNAPVGIILAVLGIMLFWVRRDRIFRGLTLISLILLMTSGVLTYLNISKEFVNINQYHAMTRGVLKDSANPETSLKSFGIDEQYAILKNNIYYEQYGTVDVNSPLLEKEFYSKYGFVSILKYYLANPDQFSSILDVAAQSAFTIKPAAMGNYEQSAGMDFRAQSHFFALYSLLKGILAPKTFGFILLWMALVIGLYMPSFIQALKARDPRGMQRMALIVASMAVGLSGIMVSIIGAGDADISKHEFLFTLAFDLVSVLAVSGVIGRRVSGSREPAAGVAPRMQKVQKGVSA